VDRLDLEPPTRLDDEQKDAGGGASELSSHSAADITVAVLTQN